MQQRPQQAHLAHLEYAGFWIRALAELIDVAVTGVVIYPVMWSTYGPEFFDFDEAFLGPMDYLFTWILPLLYTILFWFYKGATPGKMLVNIKIVDVGTGGPLTIGQCVGRSFAYLVSMIPFGLGFFLIGIDERKRAWHDLLAGTIVVHNKPGSPAPATFTSEE